jgi:hypothetical protein
MKKNILSIASIFMMLFLTISPGLAKADNSADSGSGTDSRSSTETSSSVSSGSNSHASDNVVSGGGNSSNDSDSLSATSHEPSGDDFFRTGSSTSQAAEVETEHGITFLKSHDSAGASTSSKELGVSSSGMEAETEHGVTFLKPHDSSRDTRLENNVAGRILLQVEDKGQAWYIDPVTRAKIFLGRPDDAFKVMRGRGLGITDRDLNLIPASSETGSSTSELAKKLAGRIVLQVEDKGQAWYIDPVTLKRFFLGRPDDAFKVMRGRGLGISNNHLDDIRLFLGKVGERHLTVALLADNNSGESGIAQISEAAGKIKVEIKLMGAPTSSQPAHIHSGNRPNLGAVKYPLNDVVNGLSETTLNLTLDKLLSERPLGINIHKSAAEINISVASGNL